MKTVSFIAKDVQLIENKDKNNKAFASISKNPNVTWLKCIVTDAKPNANKHRVPVEEFANIIRTGIYMPVKVAAGVIKEGHEDSFPIGTIAHLLHQGDHIEALAALWNFERPDDIEVIKNRLASDEHTDISWEIAFNVKASEMEDGITVLRETELNAITLVLRPAYKGRTPVTAIASNEGDNNDMDTIDRKDHEQIVKGLNDTYKKLSNEFEALGTKFEAVTAANEELKKAKASLDKLQPKYDELVTYKAGVDEKVAEAQKLTNIQKKFEEAGIKFTAEAFEERKEKFMAMDEASLNFFIQEFLAFSQNVSNTAEAAINITSNLPDVAGDTKVDSDDIVKFLREQDVKKE